MRVQFVLPAVLLSGALALSGCSPAPEASFSLNEKTQTLIPEAQDAVQKFLTESFGSPNHLVAWQQFPIEYGKAQPESKVATRHVDGWRLIEGRNLYMTHCLHCHGVAGDGNGPTARFLNPRPRDYRQGVFKFKSTMGSLRPTQHDLVHLLKEGIPGTYMPSFVLLGDEKLEQLADYVRWLSCRGSVEISMYNDLMAAGATEKDVRARVAEEKVKRADLLPEILEAVSEEASLQIAKDVAEGWTSAELPESRVAPKVKRTPPTKESIERGRKLYLSQVEGKKTQCSDCHGLTGRGDGPNTDLFWPVPGTTPEVKYSDVGLHDSWGFAQQPRNLTRGIYRGGRRPVDLFRRVYAGINGTQMPAFGGTVLQDDEIWDLVNYVLSIPFEGKASPYPGELEEPEAEKEVAASDKP